MFEQVSLLCPPGGRTLIDVFLERRIVLQRLPTGPTKLCDLLVCQEELRIAPLQFLLGDITPGNEFQVPLVLLKLSFQQFDLPQAPAVGKIRDLGLLGDHELVDRTT